MNALILLILLFWCCWSLAAVTTTFSPCVCCGSADCTGWCSSPATVNATFSSGTGWATCLDGITLRLDKATLDGCDYWTRSIGGQCQLASSVVANCALGSGLTIGKLAGLAVAYYPTAHTGINAGSAYVSTSSNWVFNIAPPANCGASLCANTTQGFYASPFTGGTSNEFPLTGTCGPIVFTSGSNNIDAYDQSVVGTCLNTATTQLALSP